MNSILKLSNNNCWYFYYDSNNGICFSRLNAKGELQHSGVLADESPDDFDVICDNNNCIHLCCQSKEGDILYFRYKNSEWEKTTLLTSKSNSTNKKHFHLFSINGWINILYILEYRGKHMLTHHIPERNNGEPEVVDYIGNSYTATTDNSDNIYVYYDSEMNSAFGCKMYKWSQKKWLEFCHKPNYDNCDTLLASFDLENKLSIIAEKSKEIHFITDDGTDNIISTGERPVLLSINNTHIAQWLYRGRVYSAISVNGAIFNKSGEYPINKRFTPELYRISHSNKDLRCEYCYGYRSSDGIILFELNDLCSGTNEQPEIPPKQITEKKINETSKPKVDYNNIFNNLLASVNAANETLLLIEKRLQKFDNNLCNIENIIKELPQSSSKKRKI